MTTIIKGYYIFIRNVSLVVKILVRMRKLKISLIGCHNNYLREDLIPSILSKKYNLKFISDVKNADIILQGVFSNNSNPYQNKFDRVINFFGNRLSQSRNIEKKSIKDIIDPNKNKIWIHVSGESPNNSNKASFLNSGCDYGIGHETIVNPNYVRMPHWYQSLDWSNCGFERTKDSFYRLGRPIQIAELITGIPSSEINKKFLKCAFFTSHLTAPREVFVREIQKVVDVDIFGLYGSGPAQFRNGAPKRDILKSYIFSLCPENNLFPGYITEKTPESFACGSFPISWYIDSVESDFTVESHLNIAEFGAKAVSCDGTLADLLHKKYQEIKYGGVEPLLSNNPTLDNVIEILDKAIFSYS